VNDESAIDRGKAEENIEKPKQFALADLTFVLFTLLFSTNSLI
jgi:hypothetical protein